MRKRRYLRTTVALLLIGTSVKAQVPTNRDEVLADLAGQQAKTGALLIAHSTPVGPVDEPYRESDFQPLAEMTRGKKLVLLTEPSHGMHETRLANARLVRFFVERMGFRTLLVELGFSAGAELDAYVRHGVGDIDEIVTTRLGLLWNSAEEADMFRWIAGWNVAHKRNMVRVIGMDLESDTAAGLALPKVLEAAKLPPALVARVAEGAEAANRNKGPMNAASTPEDKRLSVLYDDALRDALAALQTTPRGDARNAALHFIMSVRAGRRSAAIRLTGRDREGGRRLRDVEMARAAVAATEDSTSPAMLITNTEHLRPGRLSGDKVMSLGYHVARTLGDRAFFLGEEYGTGYMRAYVGSVAVGTRPPGQPLHAAKLDAPAPGSIAAALGDAGPLLVDLRDAHDGSNWSEWLESMQIAHFYPAITYDAGDASEPNWTVPADAFDALLYFPHVTAVHPIGAVEYAP